MNTIEINGHRVPEGTNPNAVVMYFMNKETGEVAAGWEWVQGVGVEKTPVVCNPRLVRVERDENGDWVEV